MRQFVWIVTALTALVIGQTPTGDNVYTLSNGTMCQPQGDDSNPSIIALDLQKNRPTAPTADDIDLDVTLAAMLSPGDDSSRFDATKGASVEGIVIRVKAGSVESCNCHARDQVDQDTHIELALSAGAPATQRVVVEVTPRLRKQMKAVGVDWSTAALSGQNGAASIVGKWVRITGWLFFDEVHVDVAENTNPGGEHNVRATCWEIHPITGLDVLSGPPPGALELHPRLLAQLQKAHARTLARTPALRDQVARRKADVLKKYGEAAVKEDEEGAKTRPDR